MSELLGLVERYLRDTSMTPSAFGRAVAGNPSFVFDLKRGRDVRAPLDARVRAFMVANPHGTDERPGGRIGTTRNGTSTVSTETPLAGDEGARRLAAEAGSRALLKAIHRYAQRHGHLPAEGDVA